MQYRKTRNKPPKPRRPFAMEWTIVDVWSTLDEHQGHLTMMKATNRRGEDTLGTRIGGEGEMQ